MEQDWLFDHNCLTGGKHEENDPKKLPVSEDPNVVFCLKCGEFLYKKEEKNKNE